MFIHPTAIVDKEVELASDVQVGAYSILRGKVKIGAGTIIDNHVTIGSEYGIVEIGEKNHIWAGAAIGLPPQDLSYKGEPTKLIIGNNNNIREYVTLNLGTKKGTGVTRVGNNNLIMAYTHLGHDCEFGNNIVIANAVQFAGHVTVEDNVRIGGVCAVSQFCRVGKFAYIGGFSPANKDILPYTIAQGLYAKSRATNKIGLERAGFTPEEVQNINRAVRFLIMGDRTIEQALEKIAAECKPDVHIEHMIQFIKKSEAGIAR